MNINGENDDDNDQKRELFSPPFIFVTIALHKSKLFWPTKELIDNFEENALSSNLNEKEN